MSRILQLQGIDSGEVIQLGLESTISVGNCKVRSTISLLWCLPPEG